jgi:hypothetical protein
MPPGASAITIAHELRALLRQWFIYVHALGAACFDAHRVRLQRDRPEAGGALATDLPCGAVGAVLIAAWLVGPSRRHREHGAGADAPLHAALT